MKTKVIIKEAEAWVIILLCRQIGDSFAVVNFVKAHRKQF